MIGSSYISSGFEDIKLELEHEIAQEFESFEDFDNFSFLSELFVAQTITFLMKILEINELDDNAFVCRVVLNLLVFFIRPDKQTLTSWCGSLNFNLYNIICTQIHPN